MFDLNAVAIFIQVVRAGSFAAAGRRLGMPANTLSRRVQQLETALDTRLLQRSTRKLSLTAAGRGFFEQCEGGFADIEQAGQALLDASHEPSGTVRMAAPADFFEYFPMSALAEFLIRYPRVQLAFSLSDAHTDLIADGIDLALRAGKLADSSLLARKLVDSHFVLVASPAYLQAHGMPTALAALAEHACLLMSSQGGRVWWRLDGPGGPHEVAVTGRFASNTVQSLLRAAREGLGIALLPALLLGEDLATGRLARVLPQYQYELGGVYVVYPSRHQRSPAVIALADWLANRLAALSQSAGKGAADG